MAGYIKSIGVILRHMWSWGSYNDVGFPEISVK